MERCPTEEEYLRMTVPSVATEWFESRTSPLRTTTRKARLFLCACARRVWEWLETEDNRRAVEAAERAADKLIRVKDLERFTRKTKEVATPLRHAPYGHANPAYQAAWHFPFVCIYGYVDAADVAGFYRPGAVSRQQARIAAESKAQCALVHDILGNPFRPVALARSHRTSTVFSLARAAYDERRLPGGELDPGRLAVLSDALEEAGATGEILDHLRSTGPHVRGCWAVDLCLGFT